MNDCAPRSDPLNLARDLILRPSGLDDGGSTRVFGEVLAHSVDFADLYFQLAHQESWSLEDGIVKDGSASIEQGVGVRALAGEKTGFAYSDEIVLPALEEASRAARAIAVQGGDRQVSAWRATGRTPAVPAGRPAPRPRRRRTRSPGWSASIARRASIDPRVVQVMASVTAVHEWCSSPPATANWPRTCGRWCASTSR